jgi:heme oxygenase
MAVELARLLREGTAEVHRAAERMTLIQALLRGLTDRSTYADLVAAYLEIYSALETALRCCADHPALAPLVLPELWRCEALASDLAALLGDGPAPRRSSAARAYADRIRGLAAGDPALLVAHAYTRYLGDLAGGQVLGRIIGRALDLRPGAGLDFYVFAAIDDLPAYRDAYRRRLDALPIDAATAARIVDEARVAFSCNMAVFGELEGSALRGLVRLVKGRRRGAKDPRVQAPAAA